MRGDSQDIPSLQLPVHGSPPHAWGQPNHWQVGIPYRRFTPTCVGTATTSSRRAWAAPVHPHMRGDSGRSWRRRGQREVHPHMRGDSTRTPASSASSPGSPPHAWDSTGLKGVSSAVTGSPPHAWGQLRHQIGKQHRYGFTPTCVGTAHSRSRPRIRCRVHPHMRGDSDGAPPPPYCKRGSPPHAWGQRWRPASAVL